MPLEPIGPMMRRAREGKYAVGYFESWNLESLQGVLDAAEETSSPVILGFNGEFLSRAGRLAAERLSLYGTLGQAAASASSVPCGLIFNECANDEWVRQAVTVGFNLVMPADPDASFDDYQRRVVALTHFAHKHGVAVEAELGELPCGASGRIEPHGAVTDPDLAARFVEETGIDMLAVSVGNVHILTQGRKPLDLKHLERIRQRVSLPLALHGGTGIDDDSLRAAIGLGVTKVNYGTRLKQRYLQAIGASLEMKETNPHERLGMGGEHDVMVAGRRAVCDVVRESIETLGCGGRANHV